MKSKGLNYLGVMILFVFTMSCSQKNAIVGKWQASEEGPVMEFRADGTFATQDTGSVREMGRYSFIGREGLRVELGESNRSVQTVEVSIKGDEMIFTNHGYHQKLRRVDPSKAGSGARSPSAASRSWDVIMSPVTNQMAKPVP